MESLQEAMDFYSSSSADEHPLPFAVKRRRTRGHRGAMPSPPVSASSSAFSDEESLFADEEDMANCLILLAQGSGSGRGSVSTAGKFTSKKFSEAETSTPGRAGFYVYECKTCNKCFPSFQALGGHRASHKKLKMTTAAMTAVEKKKVAYEINLPTNVIPVTRKTDSIGKGKVHECSICRSEFSSGQALGGHMRRHRPAVDSPEELKKEKIVLAIDLNLPAPAEDDNSFAISGIPLVFSPAPPLVDCLY